MADMGFRQLIGPVILAILASLFEGISFVLVIPTIKGILSGDFAFVKQTPVLKDIISILLPFFSRPNSAIFAILIVCILISVSLKNLFQYLSSATTLFLVRQFAHNLRKLIFKRYLNFGKLFFDQNSAGGLFQVLVGFSQKIANEIRILNGALYTLFTLVAYIVVMAFISWKLLIATIIIFPVFHCSVTWLVKKIKDSSYYFTQAYSELGKKISNSLSCMALIKAYTAEKREQEWFSYASERVRKYQFSIDKKMALLAPFQETIFVFMILLLVGAIAFLLVREKTGNLAGYIVFFVVLRRSSSSFGAFNNIRSSLASIKGPIKEVMKMFNSHDKHIMKDGTTELKNISKSIEVKRLRFTYPQGARVLKDVSFSASKGEMVAVVGSSGSGKTTLINMIMRFYDPLNGSIAIDGRDIKEFTFKSLRSKIALVSQETFLFNSSIRFNILYGLNRKVEEEELLCAAKKAQIYDFIMTLPKRLDTEIGDRGVKLSGGEKQRISIARAILKGPEVIILDEATSSLDSITEKKIQQAFKELIKNRTAIVIAHRLSTIKNADKIIVLEKGEIVERGTLEELLRKKGQFYLYWEEQKFY